MELSNLSAGATTLRENISGIENLANEWRRYSKGKPTTLGPEVMAITTAEVLGLIPALLAEVERLQAECNPQGAYGTGHAITLATQRKVAGLEAENEHLQSTLRMVDDWLAATLPGSSSEAIRALIAEALERKPA